MQLLFGEKFIDQSINFVQLAQESDEDTEYEHKHKSLLLKILLNTSPNGFERICRRLEIIGEAVKNLPYVFMVNYHEMKWKTLLG